MKTIALIFIGVIGFTACGENEPKIDRYAEARAEWAQMDDISQGIICDIFEMSSEEGIIKTMMSNDSRDLAEAKISVMKEEC